MPPNSMSNVNGFSRIVRVWIWPSMTTARVRSTPERIQLVPMLTMLMTIMASSGLMLSPAPRMHAMPQNVTLIIGTPMETMRRYVTKSCVARSSI